MCTYSGVAGILTREGRFGVLSENHPHFEIFTRCSNKMSAKHLAVEALGRPPLPILNLGYATLHKAYPSLALLLTSF